MTRYDELLALIKQLAEDRDFAGKSEDLTHALQRIAHTDPLVMALIWALKQTLAELAKRDAA